MSLVGDDDVGHFRIICDDMMTCTHVGISRQGN